MLDFLFFIKNPFNELFLKRFLCIIMLVIILKRNSMKKILLLMGAFFITGVANAQTEYYASMKLGAGDTTVYVQGDTKYGDYLVANGLGSSFDASGLLWEMSAAFGIDWSLDSMYGIPRKNRSGQPSRWGWLQLRLEGELGYNRYREDGKLKNNIYAVTSKTKLKMDEFFLLANGYMDFIFNKIVPYVGLGLGYSFGKEEITISDNTQSFSNFVDDNGIIYALHVGVAYKHSDITTLDLGYRRVWMPTEEDGMNVFGTIRLGARFRI